MYDPETITDIINDAKIIVSKKREKYDGLMKVIEHFISDNDIIVKDIQSYFFDLYTFDMYTLPIKLTDLLHESDPEVAKYVTLDIKIYKYHSRISIDGITFVHFTYINREIRQNILKYICLSPRAQLPCKCFGPEITLINIYANIINPLLVEEWDNILQKERDIVKEIEAYFERHIGGYDSIFNSENNIEYDNDSDSDSEFDIKYFGGARHKRKQSIIDRNMMNNWSLISQMNKIYTIKQGTSTNYNPTNISVATSGIGTIDIISDNNKDINTYRYIILNNFISEEYHVIVGQLAINVYNNIDRMGRLQIITSRDITTEVKELKGIVGDSITYHTVNLMVPTNLYLHKTTIFYEKQVIMDIYDAANTELVNYHNICTIHKDNTQKMTLLSKIKSCVNIGTPFVVMRFRLIDMWYMLYSIKLSHLDKNTAISSARRLLHEYINMRKNMNKNNVLSLNYIGFYEDILLAKQRLAVKLKVKFIQSYVPYLKKNI